MFYKALSLFDDCPLLKKKGFFVSCSKLRYRDGSDKFQDFVGGKSAKLLPRSSFLTSCSPSLCIASSEGFPSFSKFLALGDSRDESSAAEHYFFFKQMSS